jgi:hypothetical protein
MVNDLTRYKCRYKVATDPLHFKNRCQSATWKSPTLYICPLHRTGVYAPVERSNSQARIIQRGTTPAADSPDPDLLCNRVSLDSEAKFS